MSGVLDFFLKNSVIIWRGIVIFCCVMIVYNLVIIGPFTEQKAIRKTYVYQS